MFNSYLVYVAKIFVSREDLREKVSDEGRRKNIVIMKNQRKRGWGVRNGC